MACLILASRPRGIGGEPIGFVEFPDAKASVAWVMSLLSQPGVKSAKVTPLMTTAEGLEAMRLAKEKVGAGPW